MFACIHTCIYACANVCIYIYIYIYTHTRSSISSWSVRLPNQLLLNRDLILTRWLIVQPWSTSTSCLFYSVLLAVKSCLWPCRHFDVEYQWSWQIIYFLFFLFFCYFFVYIWSTRKMQVIFFCFILWFCLVNIFVLSFVPWHINLPR